MEIRCLRALAATLVMMALWLLILVPVFGDPTAPARGQRARIIYFLATLFDVMPSLFLTFLVVDATLLSRKFISRLTQLSTVRPYGTAAKFNQRFCLWGEAIADWIDMQYLARRTQCITGLSTSRFCR